MTHSDTTANQRNGTVYSWRQPSPFGKLIISASADGTVHFVQLHGAKKYWGMPSEIADKPPAAVRNISKAFERYFAGDAHAVDSLKVDFGDLPDFKRKVLTTLRKAVPAGATISYGELAELVGHPGAARAVGTTMATNPVPIILPCHRVLASDGTLGGYGGGLEMKKTLLSIEGVTAFKERKRK
jgi:methylated-DNA-[protein]-cysteine S-methyltransferase